SGEPGAGPYHAAAGEPFGREVFGLQPARFSRWDLYWQAFVSRDSAAGLIRKATWTSAGWTHRAGAVAAAFGIRETARSPRFRNTKSGAASSENRRTRSAF